MFLNEFYEDNAGNIFCFVLANDGDPLNVIHVPNNLAFEKLAKACKEGWPDADPYDPNDFCGKNMLELLEEYDLCGSVHLIGEIFGYCEPTLFPHQMGISGRKLFKEWLK
jgi:hypothetical protein